MKAALNAWQNRGLTLFGKILVVNTLTASLFVYKTTVLGYISKGREANCNTGQSTSS